MSSEDAPGADRDLTAGEIEAAFARVVPAAPPSAAYWLGLLLVALAMILLPVLYLLLVAAIAWLTWLWAVNGVGMVRTSSGLGFGGSLEYAAPLAAGVAAVVLLLKPFFSRRPPPPPDRTLRRDEAPLLFAFAEGVARAVQAPPPRRIDVNLNVNASARLARGVGSFLRRGDLVLTLGLPLAAGMTAEELAAVLAHEFGHFSQGAGMRLSLLIRSENAWLARIAYERDPWDVQLEGFRKSGGAYGAVMGTAAIALIWVVRRVLDGMVRAGHAVSCAMSRQMEFDADRRSYSLVGSATFEAAHRQIRRLAAAQSAAETSLGMAWLGRRRVDVLPRLVAAMSENLPPEVDRTLDDAAAKDTTQAFDTHPSDAARIDRARRGGAVSALGIGVPASGLFADFDAVGRELTSSVYVDLVPNAAMPACGPAEIVDHERRRAAELAAVRRYLQRLVHRHRPMLPGPEAATVAQDAAAAKQEIARSREMLLAGAEAYRSLVARLDAALERRIVVSQARDLLTAGAKIEHTSFGLWGSSLSVANEAFAAAQRDVETTDAAMAAMEAACTARMRAALGLLRLPEIAALVQDADRLRTEADAALQAMQAVRSVWPLLLRLRDDDDLLRRLFASSSGTQFEARLRPTILAKADRLKQTLSDVRARLTGPLPIEHPGGFATLGEFLIDPAAGGDPVLAAVTTASAALARLDNLHGCLLGRVALAAERAEEAAGFPPLTDPAAAAPAPNAPQPVRTSHF